MISPVLTRKKWMLYAHGQHIVIVNGEKERFIHPLMKAFLWALYMPQYPNISVEIQIDDKYKPDVVAFDEDVRLREGKPIFWGEAGRIGVPKIHSILRRYPHTHLAIAKWETRIEPFEEIIRGMLTNTSRTAPVDLIRFNNGDEERFIDEHGKISLTFQDVYRLRLLESKVR